jgi:hypothetical protein
MILKFPSKDLAVALVAQLKTKMDDLDNIYGKLEIAHGLLNTLEQVAATQERDFDETLTEYANLIGPKNLEAEMLKYSQNAKPVSDEEGIMWHLEWENKDET